MRQAVQRRVRRRKNEYVVRHGLGLIRRGDLAFTRPLLIGFNPPPTRTIMLSRALPFALRCRSVQLGTRTHLTAARRAEPPSPILRMLNPSRSWNATHRGWTSRGGPSFNTPRPPRFGFWQQISQRINRLPSDFIFWGIFGINGAVFLLWQVASTQWVSHRTLHIFRRKRSHLMVATITGSHSIGIHVQAFHRKRVEREQWSNVCDPSETHDQTHSLVHSWTLITSSFSQKDVGHLLFNGFSYYFTVPSILLALGNTGFLALYLGAGLVASVSSIWWHTSVQKQSKFSSLGASGTFPVSTSRTPLQHR